MHLLKLFAACMLSAVLLATMPSRADAARSSGNRPHVVQPSRHYLGGFTRTTQYTWTGNPTATGIWPYYGEVAVDPRVIPLYAWVHIPGLGVFRALDTGGAVWGNHVDVFTWSVTPAIHEYYRGVYWTYR